MRNLAEKTAASGEIYRSVDFVRPWRVICACVVVGLSSQIAPGPSPIGDVSSAIRIAINDGDAELGTFTPKEREQLTALYEVGGFAPLWVDAFGHPSRDAHDALALLSGAADDGLRPADYGADTLELSANALGRAPTPEVSDMARFDAVLSASMLRYFRQLHGGRVDPRAIGFRMTAPAEHDDFVALLRSALAEHRIVETTAALRPPLALYRALRGMLVRYRALAADPTLEIPPPSRIAVKPGEPYPGIRELQRLLIALGDLPAVVPAPPVAGTYNDMLVDAVKHFQIRHGLEPDGVLGKGTQAALRVPLAWRVRQIELALERLRWLPHLSQERFLAVNIPMFHLWVWDTIPPNGAPSFGTGVIVGRALNRQTPVFVEEMRYIIFRPYWNIPSSILRGEILPALKRDPDYLRRQDMEIVSGAGDDARPVALTAESLAQLQQERLRVRQRPGAKNALGLVKFVFPNDENVYLHGTPAPQLFSRTRRDFSHGCVRVEDPVALAEWALKGENEWTRDNILAAMNATQSRRVTLTRPIQVILFYITAVVMPEDGTIRFAEDIYGHDAKLDRALTR